MAFKPLHLGPWNAPEGTTPQGGPINFDYHPYYPAPQKRSHLADSARALLKMNPGRKPHTKPAPKAAPGKASPAHLKEFLQMKGEVSKGRPWTRSLSAIYDKWPVALRRKFDTWRDSTNKPVGNQNVKTGSHLGATDKAAVAAIVPHLPKNPKAVLQKLVNKQGVGRTLMLNEYGQVDLAEAAALGVSIYNDPYAWWGALRKNWRPIVGALSGPVSRWALNKAAGYYRGSHMTPVVPYEWMSRYEDRDPYQRGHITHYPQRPYALTYGSRYTSPRRPNLRLAGPRFRSPSYFEYGGNNLIGYATDSLYNAVGGHVSPGWQNVRDANFESHRRNYMIRKGYPPPGFSFRPSYRPPALPAPPAGAAPPAPVSNYYPNRNLIIEEITNEPSPPYNPYGAVVPYSRSSTNSYLPAGNTRTGTVNTQFTDHSRKRYGPDVWVQPYRRRKYEEFK